MSTDLQKDLAEAIVANKSLPRDKRKNKKELLVSTGYSPITAKSIPSVIIDSKGVRDALAEFGLTEKFITSALVADIEAKPARRIRELELGANILGMTDRESPKSNKTLIINITGETAKRYGLIAQKDAI